MFGYTFAILSVAAPVLLPMTPTPHAPPEFVEVPVGVENPPPSNTAIIALAGVLVFVLIVVKCVWAFVKTTSRTTPTAPTPILTLTDEETSLSTVPTTTSTDVVPYVPTVPASVAGNPCVASIWSVNWVHDLCAVWYFMPVASFVVATGYYMSIPVSDTRFLTRAVPANKPEHALSAVPITTSTAIVPHLPIAAPVAAYHSQPVLAACVFIYAVVWHCFSAANSVVVTGFIDTVASPGHVGQCPVVVFMTYFFQPKNGISSFGSGHILPPPSYSSPASVPATPVSQPTRPAMVHRSTKSTRGKLAHTKSRLRTQDVLPKGHWGCVACCAKREKVAAIDTKLH